MCAFLIFAHLYCSHTVREETKLKAGEYLQTLILLRGFLNKRQGHGGMLGNPYKRYYFCLSSVLLMYGKAHDDPVSSRCNLLMCVCVFICAYVLLNPRSPLPNPFTVTLCSICVHMCVYVDLYSISTMSFHLYASIFNVYQRIGCLVNHSRLALFRFLIQFVNISLSVCVCVCFCVCMLTYISSMASSSCTYVRMF